MGRKQFIVKLPVMILGIDEFFDKCIKTRTKSLASLQFTGVVSMNKRFRTGNPNGFQYRNIAVKTMVEFFEIIKGQSENRYLFGELIVVVGKRFGIQVHEI